MSLPVVESVIKAAPSFLSYFASLSHASTFISSLQGLESTFAENLVADESVKGAIIDTAVSYLQSLKAPSTVSGS